MPVVAPRNGELRAWNKSQPPSDGDLSRQAGRGRNSASETPDQEKTDNYESKEKNKKQKKKSHPSAGRGVGEPLRHLPRGDGGLPTWSWP